MKRIAALIALLTVPLLLSAQRTDLSGLKFCIDPGHGGHNAANDRYVVPEPGTEFWESESNFQKALLLKSLLEARGAWVILTRYTNDYPDDSQEPSLAARYTVANSNQVDWFHSIHSNASGQPQPTTANFTLMLVKEDIPTRTAAFPEAVTMSNIMGPAIYAKLRNQNRSVWTYLDYTFYGGPNGGFNLGVLRGALMPSELSEGSFHDYYPETRRLMNNDYRKMEAYALCYSFMSYYGVPADSLGIIAGIQTDFATGSPVNYSRVRLMPGGRIATGDQYNNGFYMFDALPQGTYTVVFETPGRYADSVQVTLSRGQTRFVDRSLVASGAPAVLTASPVNNDPQVHPLANIVLTFSKPMDTASVRSALSISPAAPGRISWNAANSQMTYDPDSALAFLTLYTLRIDTTARSSGGQGLDGNGDGTPGDRYQLQFTTRLVDIVAPYVVEASPAPLSTGNLPTGVLNVLLNEKVQPATVTTTNIAVQKVGGTLQNRILEYTELNGRAGISIHLQFVTSPGSSYRVRMSGLMDSTGNAIPSASPVLYEFGVGADQYTVRSLDLLDTALSQWMPAIASAGTVGLDSAGLTYTSSSRIRNVLTNPGSVQARYAFAPGAPEAIAAFEVAPAFADTMRWVRAGSVLQAYVYGDGSGNEFRFTVDDSVEAFPDGPPGQREASRWMRLTWVGWKLVSWDCERDSAGSWTGNGVLEGSIRLRGFQVRRAGGIQNGSILVDLIQLSQRIPVGIADNPPGAPVIFALHQNYPNPFNPSTRIRFDLPQTGDVRISVYDLVGREVAVLANGRMEAGSHTVELNGMKLASGIYFCRLAGPQGVAVRKMVLTR